MSCDKTAQFRNKLHITRVLVDRVLKIETKYFEIAEILKLTIESRLFFFKSEARILQV